ncbi:hypothetical protein niasHT_011860 [Heterodera trifolii]|uniref:Gland protein n=1 Tax=Heterodera trifolii TaxID=157864 RepID=A0ABD2KUF1_9BILA
MVVRLPAAPIGIILVIAVLVFAVHADNDHYPAYPKGPSPHYPPRGKIPPSMHSQPLNSPGYNPSAQNDDKHKQQQNDQQHQSHARPSRSAAAVGASAALSGRSVAASAPASPIGLASAQKQMNAKSISGRKSIK